jgi:hypothetical protein
VAFCVAPRDANLFTLLNSFTFPCCGLGGLEVYPNILLAASLALWKGLGAGSGGALGMPGAATDMEEVRR